MYLKMKVNYIFYMITHGSVEDGESDLAATPKTTPDNEGSSPSVATPLGGAAKKPANNKVNDEEAKKKAAAQ